MKNFSLKFIDIMMGIILALGFQWWADFTHPWQYVAFIFIYLDIIDYWIDYSPSLKKFPPKREVDVFLDVAIMFTLFLYIFATKLSVIYVLSVFIIFKVFDYMWLESSKMEYHPTGTNKVFVDTWLHFNLVEAAVAGLLIVLAMIPIVPSLDVIVAFIVVRVFMRVWASCKYKKVHFS